MAKLSSAQMNAITQVHNGETLTARKNTLDSLVRDGYLAMYTSGYVLDDAAYALGFERPSQKTATVEEVLSELDSNPWDNVTDLNGDKPFTVQQLIGNVWQSIGRVAATWGTANVWRNRMASQGLTVRVHNTISDQVWA